ncbi:MAG: hypothetical protein V3U54_08505 [Thermodesulfobacteriota bacterium]
MSTLVGVLKTWRDMYLTSVQDEDVPVINKIMTPIIAVLLVVSVITAILAYFWGWIAATGFMFTIHAVVGFVVIGILIAKACGADFS